ncbi:hypothetical protein M4D55_16585 [Metabacillus idriensis]|uniref:Uncharacterized protein n=1 Tax=Metabacillus idriensis TaxID=324768 RepID=A0A6I2M8I4_9BACI|nr:hypothetical protein [Metabacillus idriensis]MCM3597390.1 hypothetical protein [Metabacillus idriensis]MRX54139.1 hypothetical protein [Metabacillus idriensis]OHR63223.1 hypothetical protein HMPREF3291_17000 [Bacillus sp. HMSC76G11]
MGCLTALIKIPITIVILAIGWMTFSGLLNLFSANETGKAFACGLFLVVLAAILYMLWGRKRLEMRERVSDAGFFLLMLFSAILMAVGTYNGFAEGEWLLASVAALFCLVAAALCIGSFISIFEKKKENHGA